MARFIGMLAKHSKAVKYSGAGATKYVGRKHRSNYKNMMKLSDHDIQLQEYRIVDIYNNPTYVY